jgi:hypothetical protein
MRAVLLNFWRRHWSPLGLAAVFFADQASMAKRKPTVLCAILGLFLVAVPTPMAFGDTDYTYEFTANPGQVTWYNGTTFEVEVTPLPPIIFPPPDEYIDVVALDFHGACDLPAWAGDPPYYGPTPASLTPFSFSPSGLALSEISSSFSGANAFGWSGSFTGYGGGGPPQDPVSGYYAINSSSVVWGPDSGGTGQPVTVEAATGTWSLVPDAGSSFELLATAIGALGVGRFLLRGRRNHAKIQAKTVF